MQISTTELKQHINILSSVKDEDIILSKRDKPFAVVVDYQKYQDLIKESQEREIEKKLKLLEEVAGSLHLGNKTYKEMKMEMINEKYLS